MMARFAVPAARAIEVGFIGTGNPDPSFFLGRGFGLSVPQEPA
jgi:hypothetical protein